MQILEPFPKVEQSRFIASVSTVCDHCHCPVLPGEEMLPYELDLSVMKYKWSHARCVPADAPRALCKHMMKLGRCSLGDSCFFQHPFFPATLPVQQTKKKLIKSGRAFAFRRFLCAEFPELFLRPRRSPLVVDVAGGKGELSFELGNLNGARCVVLDPRPALDLSAFEEKWQRGLYVRNRHWKDFSPSYSAEAPLQKPQHWRLLFDKEVLDWVATASSEISSLQQEYERFVAKSLSTLYFTDQSLAPVQCEKKVPSLAEFVETVKTADILLGLHPDKAAEFIVDCGLLLDIPFAVVPCCVFPESFTDRKLPDGRHVRTCDEFVEYLLLKDPRIRAADLEFQGRNKCVFFSPKIEAYSQSRSPDADRQDREVRTWIASYL